VEHRSCASEQCAELDKRVAALDKRCPRPTSYPPTITDDELLKQSAARLAAATDAVLAAVQKASSEISSLRARQLRTLSSYLSLVASLHLSGEELAEAMKPVPWIGGDIDLIAQLISERPDLIGFANMAAEKESANRDEIEARIRDVAPQVAEALRKYWNGDDKALGQALVLVKSYPPADIDRFVEGAGQIGYEVQRIREQMMRMRGERALRVWIGGPTGEKCSGADLFAGAIKKEITRYEVIPFIGTTTPDKVVDQVEAELGAMSRSCKPEAGESGAVAAGCGAVLSVSIQKTAGGLFGGKGELTFILPPEAGKARRQSTEPFTIVDFDPDCRPSLRRQRAVQQFVKDLATRYSSISDRPVLEKEVPSAVARTCHCGVRVTTDRGYEGMAISAGRVRLAGQCESPGQAQVFTPRLRKKLEDARRLAGPLDPGAPVLRISAQTGDRCAVDLIAPDDGLPRWSVSAFVDVDARCGVLPDELWRSAADDVVDELSSVLRTAQTGGVANGADYRALPPPWWHAAIVAGARQLELTGGREGKAWAIADVSLLVASVVLGGLAVAERNDVEMDRGSLRLANTYFGASIAALVSVAGLRIAAGTASYWRPNDEPEGGRR
jgi:hypothetical protein